MKIIIETKADMNDIHEQMLKLRNNIESQKGFILDYEITQEGDVTTINMKNVNMDVKGRIKGLGQKLNKKMISAAFATMLRSKGYKARVNIE